MTPVLVTGGAGYVGAHTCLRLAESGFLPIVFDNLSNGHAQFVRRGPLEVGDIRDRARLDAVFAAHRPVAVLHFAALIEVAESVRDPGRFFDNNVSGAITLLQVARAAGVEHPVFSSTCATYGAPTWLPLTEDHAQHPLNPYGRSKLMVERAFWDYAAASSFRAVALRYFNAAGAAPAEGLGEWHEPESHAIPLAIAAAQGARPYFSIFSDDYDTRDGTALRDYVHVVDLADAHVLALGRLIGGGEAAAFNLGTGTGTTVREFVSGVERQDPARPHHGETRWRRRSPRRRQQPGAPASGMASVPRPGSNPRRRLAVAQPGLIASPRSHTGPAGDRLRRLASDRRSHSAATASGLDIRPWRRIAQP